MLEILLFSSFFPLVKILVYPLHYLLIPLITPIFIFKLKFSKKYFYNYEIFFFIFFIFSTMRSIFSKYFNSSLTLIIGFIICIFWYLYFYYCLKKSNSNKINKIIKIICIIFIISSLLLFFTDVGKIKDRGLYRLIGTFSDPNLFCLIGIFPIGYYFYDHKIIIKKFIFYTSLLIFFMSLSRGGIVGLLFFLLIEVYYNKKVKIKNIFLFLFFIILLILFLSENSVFLNKLMSRFRDLDFRKITDIKKLGSGRIGIWISGIEIFKENFLFGIGLNNFPNYLLEKINLFRYSHNTFLEILIENGIIGSIFYWLFLISFILNKPKNEKARIIKSIIYSQLIMSFLLTSLLSIQVFFTFALYKYFNKITFKLKETEIYREK